MYTHTENKILPYTAKQMYDLVKDIEKYPDFLPWCESLTLISQQDTVLRANMVIGYKSISESFISVVQYNDTDMKILVQYEKGPFKSLVNTWEFTDCQNGCRVQFDIKFAFKNKLLDVLLRPTFKPMVATMVQAFSNRAAQIYKKIG